jgi:hypothetical protein
MIQQAGRVTARLSLEVSPMKFYPLLRLMWIDAKLSDGGQLRRKDIMAAFNMSVAQASSDMRLYRLLVDWHLSYDRYMKVFTCDKPAFSAAARQQALITVETVHTTTEEPICKNLPQ